MTEEPFFTVREVADRLKLNPESVRRIIRQGRMHAVKLGAGKKAKLRIPESALKEFLSK